LDSNEPKDLSVDECQDSRPLSLSTLDFAYYFYEGWA
jgi:hypothetical protein